MTKTKEKLTEKMKTSLKTCRRAAATLDCWAGKASVDNFLGATTHYQDSITKQRMNLRIGKCKIMFAKGQEEFYIAYV